MTSPSDDLPLVVAFWLLVPCVAVMLVALVVEIYSTGRRHWQGQRALRIRLTAARREQLERLARKAEHERL